MKKTQRTDAFRNIKKQKVSYLSIILIALLGVTAFLGIDYSSAGAKKSASEYYNEHRFRDVEVASTMLLTQEDLEVLRGVEGVKDAEPVWQTSVKASGGDKWADVSMISMTERINVPDVIEGRLPETAEECVAEQRICEKLGWSPGDRVRFCDANGWSPEYLKGDTFTVTGIVSHPDHTSLNVPETLYVMVTKDAFDLEKLDGCSMRAVIEIEKDADVNRFEESYQKTVAAVYDRIEALAKEREDLRTASVKDPVQVEIEENEKKLAEAKTQLEDARKQLDEKKQELDDGKKKLAEEEQKLADGRIQLAEAETQLKEAKAQLEESRGQLDEAKEQLDAGKAQLDGSRAQLDEAKEQLDAGKKELDSGKKQLEDAKKKLDAGEKELTAAKKQLDSAKKELVSGYAKLETEKAAIRAAIRKAVEKAYGGSTKGKIAWAGKKTPNVNKSNVTAMEFWITKTYKVDLKKSMKQAVKDFVYSDALPDSALKQIYEQTYGKKPTKDDLSSIRASLTEEIVKGLSGYSKQYSKLQSACAKWDKGHKEYLKGRSAYNKELKTFNSKKAEYESAAAAYKKAEQKYQSSLAEYEAGEETYAKGEQEYLARLSEYEAAEAAYAEGGQKYQSGLAEYEKEKQKAEEGALQIEEAKKTLEEGAKALKEGEEQYESGLLDYNNGVFEVEEAKEKLAAAAPCTWVVMDPEQNASFVQTRIGSDNLKSLEMTFSLMFILVGALVIYATIAKMVDEQRSLVGTTKALGFFTREIFAKYLAFGVSATLIGTGLGILLARFVLEPFVLKNFSKYYTYGMSRPAVSGAATGIVLLAGILLAVAAIGFACLRLLREPAVRLLQAKVPAGRKQASSERHLLPLYTRLILSNIRSDIKRVIVTVFSIAGCCCLVVIGFTMKASVNGAAENQYTKLVNFDERVKYNGAFDMDTEELVTKTLEDEGTDCMAVSVVSACLQMPGTEVVELQCCDLSRLPEYFNLMDWKTGSPITPEREGILVQRRLAEIYGLEPGSEAELVIGAVNKVKVKISGIFENYIGRQVLIDADYYKEVTGLSCYPNQYYVKLNGVDPQLLNQKLSLIAGYEGMSSAAEDKEFFEASTSVINIIVVIFIVIAAVMAFVVLLNLVNINILSKKRELTIMRVNGFTVRETKGYITKENFVTTVLGILIGIGMGAVISYWIIRSIEQSFFQLERGVSPLSWLIGAAITAAFAVLINIIALRKVKDLKLTDVA
ncbi:MAG: FtsX-like permease family protein [Lachnospiraceae bacterium]|nr:FtsX-like permease family protein [Lachnospiraceae bacterium]